MAEERVDEPRGHLASSADGQSPLENDEAVPEGLVVVTFEVALKQLPRLGCERALPCRRLVVESHPAGVVGARETRVSEVQVCKVGKDVRCTVKGQPNALLRQDLEQRRHIDAQSPCRRERRVERSGLRKEGDDGLRIEREVFNRTSAQR